MPENNSTGRQSNSKSEQESNERARHIIYELLLAGVVMSVVTFYGIWPTSHGFALIIVAVTWSSLALYEMAFVYKVKHRWTAAFCISTFIVAGTAYSIVGPNHTPEDEKLGALIPGNAPTPPNGCDRLPQTLSSDALRILIGDNAFVLSGVGRITALQVGTCPVLSIERTPRGVSVDADLYDIHGKMVATLRDGQFHVLTGDDVKIGRNGDLSTLVVSDGAGEELLYVRYLNPTTVIARGVFGCSGHSPVRVKSEEPVPGNQMHGVCMVNTRTGIQLQ
jgi:hypothetical protein